MTYQIFMLGEKRPDNTGAMTEREQRRIAAAERQAAREENLRYVRSSKKFNVPFVYGIQGN